MLHEGNLLDEDMKTLLKTIDKTSSSEFQRSSLFNYVQPLAYSLWQAYGQRLKHASRTKNVDLWDSLHNAGLDAKRRQSLIHIMGRLHVSMRRESTKMDEMGAPQLLRQHATIPGNHLHEEQYHWLVEQLTNVVTHNHQVDQLT